MKTKPRKKKAPPLRIVGGVFVGPTPPDREAITYSGRDNIVIKDVEVGGGCSCIRLVDCGDIRIIRPRLARPLGPPDPDGQCLQLIRPRGRVLIEDPECFAGDDAEDIISIFADKPVKARVLIRGGQLTGRGTSESSTSIICDGRHCPPTEVTGVTIVRARVGIQLAGGTGHNVHDNTLINCEHDVEVYNWYAKHGRLVGWRVSNSGRVNVGAGSVGVVDGKTVGKKGMR